MRHFGVAQQAQQIVGVLSVLLAAATSHHVAMLETILAMFGEFAPGVLLVLVTAAVTLAFQRFDESRKKRAEITRATYHGLIDLYNAHFWITVAEVHKEPPKPHHVDRVREIAWQMADKLRESDDPELTSVITRIVFGEAFQSESARAKAIDALILKLGKRVNPNYAKAMKVIHDENLSLMTQNPLHEFKAPGSHH